MDRYALGQELVNDPLTRGYAGMDDAQAAVDLNTVYRTRMVALDTRRLLEWGASNQRFKNIEDNQNNANADVANLCRVGITMIRRDEVELDMANPAHEAFIDSLVAGGALRQSDKDALVAMATEAISRSADLFGVTVTQGDVERARAG